MITYFKVRLLLLYIFVIAGIIDLEMINNEVKEVIIT